MSDRRLWQLEGDLRQAFENYNGGQVSGPWDDLIETLAQAVHLNNFDLGIAARVQLLLNRTNGGAAPYECDTCKCPQPGVNHRTTHCPDCDGDHL